MVSVGGKESGGTAVTASSVANGILVPTKYFILMLVTVTALIALQVRSFLHGKRDEVEDAYDQHVKKLSYHESLPVLRNQDHAQCRFYMAESAVAPGAGLGMFTATGLLQEDVIGFPDICIFVSDAPKRWTHLR